MFVCICVYIYTHMYEEIFVFRRHRRKIAYIHRLCGVFCDTYVRVCMSVHVYMYVCMSCDDADENKLIYADMFAKCVSFA